MQIGIQTNTNIKPIVFEMSKEKINILMKFIHTFAKEKINENSEEYRRFLSDEIIKSLKTKRVSSGNTLREIIE